jgi:hypothetical protein
MMADESQALVVQTGPLVMRGEMDISATRARVDDFVERIKLMDEVVTKLMEEGDGADYWKIPTAKKPSLLNAGADKLNAFFGYAPSFEVVDSFLDKLTWVYSVKYRCILTHRDSGVVVGEGIGSCTNRESKYYYRQGAHKCPKCGAEALVHSGKKNGWFCVPDKSGCRAWFPDAGAEAKVIGAQDTAKIVNPDLADTLNTIDKMAQKRSKVAAVLNVTGLTRKYTQDVEDAPRQAAGGGEPPEDQPYTPEDTHTTDRKPSAPVEPAKPAPVRLDKTTLEIFANQVKDMTPELADKDRAALIAKVGKATIPSYAVPAWNDWRYLTVEQLDPLLAAIKVEIEKGDK